jgi:hypothetical protein
MNTEKSSSRRKNSHFAAEKNTGLKNLDELNETYVNIPDNIRSIL